ncbi:MAG: hypothetical protein ABIL17_08600 [candidate division WOR-3 bacterium]
MKDKFELRYIHFGIALVGAIVVGLGMAFLGKHLPQLISDIVFIFLVLSVVAVMLGFKTEPKKA